MRKKRKIDSLALEKVVRKNLFSTTFYDISNTKKYFYFLQLFANQMDVMDYQKIK